MSSPPTPLGSAQVARLLGRSLRRVQEYAHNGQLPHVRVGARGHYVFTIEDVERLLEPRRGEGEAA